jgi:hypothetical protein
MFKLVSHAVIFSLGAGLGVWWGTNHPTQAAIVAGREDTYITRIKAEVAKAKVDLLEKFLGSGPTNNNAAPASTTQPTSADFRKMLDDERQNLGKPQ